MVKLGETAAEVYGVSADLDNSRCPRCAAFVRPGSQWCTLCYADLRPAPAIEPHSEPAAYAEPPARGDAVPNPPSHALDPLTAPLALLDREPAAPDAPRAGKHAAPADEAESGWPCAACGATAPFDEVSCPSCGAGFLENVDTDTSLHHFGLATGPISNQTKVFIMVGGSLGLLVVLLGLMYVIGTVL